MANPKNKIQQAKNELAPAIEVADQKNLSNFKVKDEYFSKIKTYIEKSSKQEKQIEADWLNLHVGGVPIVAHKGQPLTKTQLQAFDKEAKEFWLESIK